MPGTWNVNSKCPALQKIKEDSTWCVSSKCLTSTLEIKVEVSGTWNVNSKSPAREKLSQKLLDM